MQLPLFPLNTVVFPGGVLPLRIFEARYLDMVGACVRDDTGFAVCLIREGREAGGTATVHTTGTECKIVDWQKLPDGLLGVTAQGKRKLRVLATRVEPNHLVVGQFAFLAERPELPLPGQFTSLSKLLKRIVTEIGHPYTTLPDQYHQAGWVGARLAELLPLALPLKQQLLEINDPIERLNQLRDALTGIHYV